VIQFRQLNHGLDRHEEFRGGLSCPVEVASVFLDQDAGHVLLEAGRRPRTGTVRLIQGRPGIMHPGAADKDENQAGVSFTSVS